MTAGHTLFLEEWELEPGDVVSYYAVARDNRSGQAEESLSDIYFINVRPFRRDFRQAEEQPQGGEPPPGGEQPGEGQGDGGSLSELQREVVAATFNLLRDQESYTSEEFGENTVSVALAQRRVRDEVASLLVQMNTRGLSQADPHFQEIAELLPVAIQDIPKFEAQNNLSINVYGFVDEEGLCVYHLTQHYDGRTQIHLLLLVDGKNNTTALSNLWTPCFYDKIVTTTGNFSATDVCATFQMQTDTINTS